MKRRHIRVTVSVEDDEKGRCASERVEVMTPVEPDLLYALYKQAFWRMREQASIKRKKRAA